jgi:hypothetical protein
MEDVFWRKKPYRDDAETSSFEQRSPEYFEM